MCTAHTMHGAPEVCCCIALLMRCRADDVNPVFSQDPDASVKGDLPRFLWNFLAERTAQLQPQVGAETAHTAPDC